MNKISAHSLHHVRWDIWTRKHFFSCILVPYLTIVVKLCTNHSHESYLPSNHEGPSTKHFGKVEDSHQHCPIWNYVNPKTKKKALIILQNLRVLMES